MVSLFFLLRLGLICDLDLGEEDTLGGGGGGGGGGGESLMSLVEADP